MPASVRTYRWFGQAPWHVAGGDDPLLLLLGELVNYMVSDHVPLRHTADMVSDHVPLTDHVPFRAPPDMVSDQVARPIAVLVRSARPASCRHSETIRILPDHAASMSVWAKSSPLNSSGSPVAFASA